MMSMGIVSISTQHHLNPFTSTMAPVEIDTIPMDIMAPIKNMKVVNKAFELPLVTSAYDEITKMAAPISPYVENSVTTITPMVEIGYNTIKAKVEENVMPHLPEGISESVQANMTSAVDHITAAVEKIDTLACGGLDQLTEKVPALKEETPELIANSKETATSYFTLATTYMASFSLAQVALKVLDSGLDVVEGAVILTGASEEGTTWSSIKKIHAIANTVRIDGNKMAGTIKARKIEEASILGALAEVSGLNYILGSLGLLASAEEDSTEDVIEVTTEDDAEKTFDDYDDEVEEVVDECNTPACAKVAHSRI